LQQNFPHYDEKIADLVRKTDEVSHSTANLVSKHESNQQANNLAEMMKEHISAMQLELVKGFE
jgi:hypothetical protein